jgi:hypothetical protein
MSIDIVAPKREKPTDVEMQPDGGQRFEKAVDAAIKSGPKHRPPKAQYKPDEPKKEKPSR